MRGSRRWQRPRAERASARPKGLALPRTLFVLPPTGRYCREDRCQSSFRFELVPSLRAPLEEAEAAGAIRDAGGEALVLDAPALGWPERHVEAEIAALAPDLTVLVATFGTLDRDLEWVERVRRLLPRTTIALRGAPCYTHAEAILARAPALDLCVRGDYELTFAALVCDGAGGAPGITRRDPAAPELVVASPAPRADDLDALPWPDRDAVDGELYRVRGLGAPQATIRVQRGCPFPCRYCLVHTVSGDVARQRSPHGIASEMAALRERGYRHFYLRADTFSVDRAWAIAVSEAIRAGVPDARWVTTTRVECVDDAVIGAMAAAGCYGISFGIDVASRAIGARVRKLTRLDDARAAVAACHRHGVLSLAYLMIGFLWETAATLRETAEFAAALRSDLLTVHFAHPYPGTPYHADVLAAGAAFDAVGAQARPALHDGTSAGAGGLPAPQLERAARAMLLRHYRDPAVVVAVARKLGRLALDRWRPRGSRRAEARAAALAR